MSEYNEPWKVGEFGISDATNRLVAMANESSPNLRARIVAAVNFCAGITDKELSQGTCRQLFQTIALLEKPITNFGSDPTPTPRHHLDPALMEALRDFIVISTGVNWQRVLAANEVKP